MSSSSSLPRITEEQGNAQEQVSSAGVSSAVGGVYQVSYPGMAVPVAGLQSTGKTPMVVQTPQGAVMCASGYPVPTQPSVVAQPQAGNDVELQAMNLNEPLHPHGDHSDDSFHHSNSVSRYCHRHNKLIGGMGLLAILFFFGGDRAIHKLKHWHHHWHHDHPPRHYLKACKNVSVESWYDDKSEYSSADSKYWSDSWPNSNEMEWPESDYSEESYTKSHGYATKRENLELEQQSLDEALEKEKHLSKSDETEGSDSVVKDVDDDNLGPDGKHKTFGPDGIQKKGKGKGKDDHHDKKGEGKGKGDDPKGKGKGAGDHIPDADDKKGKGRGDDHKGKGKGPDHHDVKPSNDGDSKPVDDNHDFRNHSNSAGSKDASPQPEAVFEVASSKRVLKQKLLRGFYGEDIVANANATDDDKRDANVPGDTENRHHSKGEGIDGKSKGHKGHPHHHHGNHRHHGKPHYPYKGKGNGNRWHIDNLCVDEYGQVHEERKESAKQDAKEVPSSEESNV